MKLIAAVAVTLLVSCASSTGVIDRRYLDCESGHDVSIATGLDAPLLHEDGTEDRFKVLVEVSNNSHDDVVVKSVRVDQRTDESTTYVVERGYGEYDQVIPPGKDHTFELAVAGRAARRSSRSLNESRAIELVVSVVLENGDHYRCLFALGPSR